MEVDEKKTIHTESHASERKGETKTSHSSTYNKIKHLDNVWVMELPHQLNLHKKVLLRPRSQTVQVNALYSNQIMRRTLQYTERWVQSFFTVTDSDIRSELAGVMHNAW